QNETPAASERVNRQPQGKCQSAVPLRPDSLLSYHQLPVNPCLPSHGCWGPLMNKIITIFKIPELAQKIGITLLFLIIYRIGYHVPLPFINQQEMLKQSAAMQQGALGQVLGFVSLFSGGNFNQSTIFGLGIMPYISASIIFQLLASVYPPLEKLQKEGESG